MSKHLQVSIQASSPLALNVTPIDLAIPDTAAAEIVAAIALVDAGDATPGDGMIEETSRQHVKFNVSFVHIDQTINLTGVLKVVDKP